MAIKTKDELITDFDATVTDGGEATAAEFRTINDDTVDSMDNFRSDAGDSKGTFKATGNVDLSIDEEGDFRILYKDTLIMQQTYVAATWTTTQIIVPFGTQLLYKATGNTDYVTAEAGDYYVSIESGNLVTTVV